jgi:ComEC/Rec2-related protein
MLFFLAGITFFIGVGFWSVVENVSMGILWSLLVSSFLLIGWGWYRWVPLLLVGIASLIGYTLARGEYDVRIQNYSSLVTLTDSFSGKYTILGEVEDFLYKTDFQNVYRLKIDKIDTISTQKARDVSGLQLGVFLSVPNNLHINTGDQIRFTAKIDPVITFPLKDFSRYAWYHEVYGKVYAPLFERTKVAEPTWQQEIQEWTKKIIFQGFPRDTAGIILGMSIGNIDLLSKKIKDDFTNSGIIHILVVSGSNIAFVILIIQSILQYLPMWRMVRFLFVFAFILLYATLVGWEIPVLRAVVMWTLSYLAIEYCNRLSSVAILFLVAIVFVVISPLSLVYDASFWLSFGATLWIILLHPFFQWVGKKIWVPKFFNDIFSVTLGATIASSIAVLYHFGRIPLFSLVANLLIGVFLGWILIATVIYLVLSIFWSSVLYFWGWCIYLPVTYIIRVAEYFRSTYILTLDEALSRPLAIVAIGILVAILFLIEEYKLSLQTK